MHKYQPSHFRADWSKVGVFVAAGMQQNSENYCLVNLKDVCGKGVVNENTVLVYTRDMWLV